MTDSPKYTLKWLFFGFTGRIRRSTYIWSTVFFVALNAYVVMSIVTTPKESTAFGLWGLAMLAMLIVSTWASIALSAKRLHDIGFSGFLSLLMFIPMASMIFFLALCVMPGEARDNQYGTSPIPSSR